MLVSFRFDRQIGRHRPWAEQEREGQPARSRLPRKTCWISFGHTYATAPAFVARGAGTIINIASVVGISPETLNGVYGATKAYVIAFSHSLQHELAGKGIRVQAVLPGATATDLWELAGLPVTTSAPDESFTTMALSINFFRPVWQARLRADARVVNRGQNVG